ncbi:hypothetical protein [Streptomyces sp. NPDC018000]|uniref:hypothetical protein n=1 Tax=Streptomyces sp. NPDC018000 TaxID=3365028 RepID=UPI0037AC3CB6
MTYAPGTFAKLESIDGDINKAQLLQAQAEATDGSRKTASLINLAPPPARPLAPSTRRGA